MALTDILHFLCFTDEASEKFLIWKHVYLQQVICVCVLFSLRIIKIFPEYDLFKADLYIQMSYNAAMSLYQTLSVHMGELGQHANLKNVKTIIKQ